MNDPVRAPKDGRLLRGCAWAAALACALAAGALIALQLIARRAETNLHASTAAIAATPLPEAPRRIVPVRPTPAAEWPALKRLVAESPIAGTARPVPVASSAPDAGGASVTGTLDVAPLVLVASQIDRAGWDFVFSLLKARRDEDAPLSGSLRAPLEAHADEIVALTAHVLAHGDRGLLGLDERGLRRLRVLLMLDAVRAGDAGDRVAARDRLAAVLVSSALDATLGSNPTPWIPHGVLRRVRPPRPDAFLDVLDSEARGGEWYLASLLDTAIGPRLRPPGFEIPTLDALHEGLPSPLRSAVSSLVLEPIDRARRAKAAPALLRAREELSALGHCPSGTAWIQDAANADFATSWRWAIDDESGVLFTREVLRASLPEGEVARRSSGCADWTVSVEDLGDGMRRVTLVGLGNREDGRPPGYDVPAPR